VSPAGGQNKGHRSPNNLGTVHQRENGRWVWQEDFGKDPETGRRIRPTRERATREEVLQARDEALAELKRRPVVAPPVPGTVADWLSEWLRIVARNVTAGGSPNTYSNYEGSCRRYIIPAIGEVRLMSLTSRQVADMLEPLSPGTLLMVRKTLAAAWREAWRQEKVSDENLVRRVPAKLPPTTTLAAATPDEAKAALISSLVGPATAAAESMRARDLARVLKHLENERLRARWLSGLIFGGRQSEILGLCWPDLVEIGDQGLLTIRRSRIRQQWEHGCHRLAPCGRSAGACPKRAWMSTFKGPKTPGSVRTVHVSPGMLSILKDWKARQSIEMSVLAEPPEIPWMFTTPDGLPPTHSADQKAWQDVLIKAKVSRHYSLHHLRHTSASEAAADPTIDIQTLMGMLGWTRRSTAEHYSHARDDRMQAAWEQHQERFLGQSLGPQQPPGSFQ
jgi:integrase